METAFRILLKIQIMMAIGMRSIAAARMVLQGHRGKLDHKDLRDRVAD